MATLAKPNKCEYKCKNSSQFSHRITVLFQFFDPLYHCFTFPDYQLVPTLEEFSQLLRTPILNQQPFNGTEIDPNPEEIVQALHLQLSNVTTNWETRSGVRGFLAKFLFEKAQICWNSLDFQAFEEIMALLIYEMVLFPNPDQLIDVNPSKSSCLVTRCLLC